MPEDSSRNFDSNFFLDKVNRWTEGPRLDFKEVYYNLKDEEQLVKFIKHVIAFSNVARRIGKVCWILFGVKDDTKEILDIRDKFPSKQPKGWNNPKVDFGSMMTQGFVEEFRNCFTAWISPVIPDFTFEYGYVIDQKDNKRKFVSYLIIEPTSTETHFCLKKSPQSGKYKVGDTFIRKNSSTVSVAKDQERYLLSRSKIEYFSKHDWEKIVNHHLTGDFQRFMYIQPYITPGIEKCEDKVDSIQAIMDNIKMHKIQVIIGGRGEGKSILLHRVAYKLAEQASNWITQVYEYGQSDDRNMENDDYIVESIEKEIEIEAKSPIPIYFSLRTSFQSVTDFENQICGLINSILAKIKNTFSNLSAFTNMPGTRWVILLDGVDELRNKDVAGQELQKWLRYLPENVNVIMTARPLSVIGIDDYYRMKIKPLSTTQIDQLLQTRINENSVFFDAFKFTDSNPFQTIKDWVISNPDIQNLLTNFRALDCFIKYLIPSNILVKPDIDDMLPIVDYKNEEKSIIKEKEGEINKPAINDLTFDDADLAYENRISLNEQKTGSDTEFEEPFNTEIEDLREEFIIPEISIVLKSIIDSLENDEIHRMQGINTNTPQFARNTRNSLCRIAWYDNWDNVEFNCEKYKVKKKWIDDDQLYWGENIGYIQHNPNYIFYKFIDSLIRIYFAAEYAFESRLENEDVISMVDNQKRRIKNETAIQKLISILNGLLNANGREKLNINFGG